MEPTCQELIKILEEQRENYRQLMDLSVQKHQYLINGDLDELNELTMQEETLIFQLGKLEGKREKCFSLLAELGGFDENFTLQEVLPQLPQNSQEQLRQIQKDFSVLIQDLAKLNEENMLLLEQSLRFVNFTVESISQQSKPLYNAENKVKVEQLNNILDKKV
ncbi:MAG: flagellar protein FlgN [Peptococcia bacterium]|jgi:flagellar biosynthesis/type III secretory pathway chaperone